MRFSIYFFLFMSGFFYLTGNPIADKGAKTSPAGTTSKFAQLKYARKTSRNRHVEPSADVKSEAVKGSMQEIAEKQAQQPVKKAATIEKTKIIAESVVLHQSESQGSPTAAQPEGRKKPGNISSGKSLDWTVFGNHNRVEKVVLTRSGKAAKNVRDTESRRADTRDREQANGRTSKKIRSHTGRKAKRLIVKKRARSLRKSKLKRFARLKRRNAGVYRIARRVKKKTKRSRRRITKRSSRRVTKRARRKKFGFSTTGGGSSLGSF